MPARRRARGFTLIEMMTAITVMALLLAVASPGLAAFVRSSRVNSVQSELVAATMLARSEASKRGQDVQVIAQSGAIDSDFVNGWLIWWDANGDGVIDRSANSVEILRSYPPPGGDIVVKAPVNGNSVRFTASGFLSPAATRVFVVCDTRAPTKGHQVSIEAVGLTDVRPTTTCP